MPRDGSPSRASHGGGASAPPRSDASPTTESSCSACNKPPAAGTKLHVCAKCQMISYCNAACQRADCASHKRDCKAFGEMHQRAVAIAAAHKAEGSPQRNAKFLLEWYDACPDLALKAGPSKQRETVFQLNLSRFGPVPT